VSARSEASRAMLESKHRSDGPTAWTTALALRAEGRGLLAASALTLGLIHQTSWKGCSRKLAAGDRTHAAGNIPARLLRKGYPPVVHPLPCLPRCRLLPLGDLAARRACAAPSSHAPQIRLHLLQVRLHLAHILLVGHVEADLDCVLVAADYGRYSTPMMRSFLSR
jgi:hypothetical protein